MALPACFHLAEEVFPRVRAEAARRMTRSGMSQAQAATQLGCSQAMVSNYAGRPDDDDPLVLRLVDDLLDDAPSPSWCGLLGTSSDEEITDLLAAERRLLRSDRIDLVPQVGLNIARCRDGATDVDDVLSYPARIVAAGDRMVRPVAPAWGASGHLAACLLTLHRADPGVHALVNVRGGAFAARLANVVTMASDGDRTQAFVAAVDGRAAALIHDPGAIGIEPCLYIAGTTAVAAIDTLLRLPKVTQ